MTPEAQAAQALDVEPAAIISARPTPAGIRVLVDRGIKGITLHLIPATRAASQPAPVPAELDPGPDYGALTVAELKEAAKGREIAGYSTMRKAELVAALQE